MKKTILILLLIMFCGTILKAQDTIVSKVPQKNYLVPYDWWGNADSLYDLSVYAGWNVYDITRYCLAKDDSLLVYGIAAGMITSDYKMIALGYGDSTHYLEYPVDTTHDLTESLRLYEYSSGRNALYQIGEDLPVNALHTPVSYYQQFPQPLWVPFFDSTRTPPLPVYERYFSHPIVVRDSFYVGVTADSHLKLASEGYRYHYWINHY